MESIIPILVKETGDYIGFIYILERILKAKNKYEILLKLSCKKKLSNYNNITMDLLRNVKMVYLKFRLFFQEREDQKLKAKEVHLNKLKREKKILEDEIKEKELFLKFGFCKCTACQTFMSPDQILAICDEKVNSLTDLDVNVCQKLNLRCKCAAPFKSKMLDNYSNKYGNKSAVDFLNKKKSDLVYVNMNVIKHENKCY